MNLYATEIIRPNYLRTFRCTPEACLETCCERWQIQIDRSTYERYIECEDQRIRRIAKRFVKKNEQSLSTRDHAYIRLDAMGRCPFLNGEAYCTIQLTLGEEGLSETCKTYPRVITRVGDRMMLGLEPTCSVAAKEILFNPEAMDVDLKPPGKEIMPHLIDQRDRDTSEAAVETVWIQQQVINLLRDRNVTLDERLHRVGAYLIRVLAGHHPGEMADEEGYHLFNPRTFEHLNHLLSIKFPTGDQVGFFSRRYPRLLNDVLDGFEKMPGGKEGAIYQAVFERQVMVYLEKRPHLVENFITNHVYLYGSILFENDRIWRSYLEICLLVALLQFHLVGLTMKRNRLTDELVLSLVESFSRTFLQDRSYFNEAVMYLISQRLDTPEAVTGLIVPL